MISILLILVDIPSVKSNIPNLELIYLMYKLNSVYNQLHIRSVKIDILDNFVILFEKRILQ